MRASVAVQSAGHTVAPMEAVEETKALPSGESVAESIEMKKTRRTARLLLRLLPVLLLLGAGAQGWAGSADIEDGTTYTPYSDEGDDHGNNRSTATGVALPSTTTGTIDPGNDTDWFRFEVPATGGVGWAHVLVVMESSGDLDTLGTLFDASGNLVVQDDDSAGYPNFRIERALEPGTYYVRVHSYQRATGGYTLHLRWDGGGGGGGGGEGDDHGSTRATATPVALPSMVVGRIDPTGDEDWFRLDLSHAGTFTARGSVTSGTLVLAFSLGSRSVYRPGSTELDFEIHLGAGTYYLVVKHDDNDSDGTGTYTLDLSFEAAGGGGDNHGNSRSTATRVTLPSTTAGTIDPGNDTDYFHFDVSATGTVMMESSGDLDTLGTLFDARGNRIVQDDDGAGYPNFRIEQTLDPGTYYVRVHSSGRATGGYTLHLRGDGDGGSATVAPGESFRDCDVCPLMVSVPAGAFLMGSTLSDPHSTYDERPQRTVSVPAFAAGAFEVTFTEWDACVAEGGCWGYRPYDEGWGRGGRPVIHVTWEDAELYVEWLSRKTGQTYRLPTEAEWEYAARAGTTTPFNTGGTISPQLANFDGRYEWPDGYDARGLYRVQTMPVGSFPPNAFGLYDMHGNIREYVEGCYGGYGDAPVDGSASEFGRCTYRVSRGGSWFNGPAGLRSATRAVYDGGRNYGDGFRVVRTLSNGAVGAPTVNDEIEIQSLTLGTDSVLDLSGAFSANQALTYEVRSSNADVVRVSVSGSQLTLMPAAEGAANVTVAARDADGNEATMSFPVVVAGGGSATVVPDESFRDCDVCPLMVSVPEGSFLMGAPESEPLSESDERPQRAVSVPAFAMGAFEVTFAEWDACVDEGGCLDYYGGVGYRPGDEDWGRGDRPVIHVDRNDAQRYVEWLSRKTGWTYRLPSEAEWEYAARAGTTTPFSTGGTISPQQANFDGRHVYPDGDDKEGLYRKQTVPVGSFAPNAFGLYDMHGNVHEWVEDCYGSYGNAPTDGSASEFGRCTYHVLRGGSWIYRVVRDGDWIDLPGALRSAARDRVSIHGYNRSALGGFRVVRTLAHSNGAVGAPTVNDEIERQSLTLGSDSVLDLSGAFSDDQSLAYEVRSSNANVVRVSVSGSLLTLMLAAEGAATVTVTARDTDGNEATMSFVVVVTDGGSATVALDESFSDCDVCPLMVSVPAGAFLMGAPESEPHSNDGERPQRTVSVPAFAMGAFEVTFAEWEACVSDNGCGGYRPDRPNDVDWGRTDRPVIEVSWNYAQLYVEWLSRKTGQAYRLPTEAEWEYAARAGTTTPFNTGGTISPQQANFDDRYGYPDHYNGGGGLYRGRTMPVGSFAPNAFGLYDVHGNVREWVQDCDGGYGNAPSNGSASEVDDCSYRVLRGGSYWDEPRKLRSAVRDGFRTGSRNFFVGFRVVRTLTNSAVGAPTVNEEIERQSLTLGSDSVLDLSGAFLDDQNLTYEIRSSNGDVVRVSVSGSLLTLMPVAEGTATVTVTARDADGNEAAMSFAIVVIDGGSPVAPGEGFRDCDVCPLMVSVPAGSFLMGAPESEPFSQSSERPQRTVSVPAFAAGAYEVTFAEWDACVAEGGCGDYRPDDEGWGRGDRPVINVTWDDAQLYVEWLSRKTGQRYWLPSEAEWEYAARAGTTTPFNTGGTISPQEANFDGRYGYPDGDETFGLHREQTVTVGSFAPNEFGLYDSHGNVWELVQDCGGPYGSAPADGSASYASYDGTCLHISRGGSWINSPSYLRSAMRVGGDSGYRDYATGFRVVRRSPPARGGGHGRGERGESFRDCDVCPPMVSVPAGSFLMGAPESEPHTNDDERPRRIVSVPAFAMGAYEVTFAEWDACFADGGCPDNPGPRDIWHPGDRPVIPVITVSWEDAQLYVEWLSRKTGETYRLPTEAEWEYAARAGTTTPFNTGVTISPQQANFDGDQPVSVGSFAPSAFGLYDMHGNVYEWVQDCYGSYGDAPTDGSASEVGSCTSHVVRGGGWSGDSRYLRSAYRSQGSRDGWGSFFVGFRVARTLAP